MDRNEILMICASFYAELCNSALQDQHPVLENTSPDSSEVLPIMTSEVKKTLKEMKSSKAPGIGNLISYVMILGEEESVKQITKFFKQILETKKIPVEWEEAKMIILHKKGDMKDIKSYRPISLLFHMYKLFSRILKNKTKQNQTTTTTKQQQNTKQTKTNKQKSPTPNGKRFWKKTNHENRMASEKVTQPLIIFNYSTINQLIYKCNDFTRPI